jgi:phospholipid/cholesterol/gamma-HCH transport system permease protein
MEFFHVTLMQIYFTFVQAIPLTLMMGVLIGLAVSFQVQLGLAFVGGFSKLGEILAIILFRELTPLFVTMLIIIRSATAITSEIATMKVQQEIDALEIMGISVAEYILLPRIVAGAISFFCMAVVFMMAALVGSWLGANLNSNFPVSRLISGFSLALSPIDFLFFLVKNTVIGCVIFLHACKMGLSLEKAPFEVPIVTNKSVVDCLILGVSLQLVFSFIFYLIVGIEL